MKVSVLQEQLKQGLDAAARVTDSKIDVLSHIHLRTGEARLVLTGSRLVQTLQVWAGARVDKSGDALVDAKSFREFIHSLPPERVDLTHDPLKNTLHVKCGATSANFRTSALEYPTPPDVAATVPLFSIPAKRLSDILNRVVYAASKDEGGRPILTGVHFRRQDGVLAAEAANGFRLATTSSNGWTDWAFEAVIPRQSLEVLLSMLKGDGDVNVYSLGSRVAFAGDFGILDTLTLEGRYPDVEAIIPKTSRTTAEVRKGDLRRAMKLAEVFARDSNNAVKVTVTPPDLGGQYGQIHWSARSPERGDNSGTLAVEVDGEACEVSFNAGYLMDALDAIPEDVVVLELNGSDGVLLARGKESSAARSLHIFMPMSTGH